MSVEHRTLGHADVHEPKHISISGTSDAGKVITSSATINGVSEYRKLKSSEINDDTFAQYKAYGGKTIKNNATVIAKTAAVDTTFNTASDYSQVTGLFESPDVAPFYNVTSQTNTFTVPVTGHYVIDFWTVTSAAMANTDVAFNIGVNGAVSTDRPVTTRVIGANDRMCIAAHSQTLLTAGDVVSLWLASSNTTNIRIHHARFSVTLLRRTV